MGVRAKELRYAVDLRDDGTLRTENGAPLETDPGWSSEHLLLAALVRCSLQSLRYHARRVRIDVEEAHGEARALVTKRPSDGRYGVVEATVELEVRLVPLPGEAELAALLEKAERDCFIGASLTAVPEYRWTVI